MVNALCVGSLIFDVIAMVGYWIEVFQASRSSCYDL